MNLRLVTSLIKAAMETGYKFSSTDPAVIVKKMRDEGPNEDLRLLGAYTVRYNVDKTEAMLRLYQEVTASSARIDSKTQRLVQPNQDHDTLEAMFFIDMSEMRPAAKDSLKALYHLHSTDPDMQERYRHWMHGLHFCTSPAHLGNIESVLPEAAADVGGHRARLLRILLENAPDLSSYDFDLFPDASVYTDLEQSRILISVDDPLQIDRSKNIVRIVDSPNSFGFRTEVLLPHGMTRQGYLQTSLGLMKINSQYTLRVPGDLDPVGKRSNNHFGPEAVSSQYFTFRRALEGRATAVLSQSALTMLSGGKFKLQR